MMATPTKRLTLWDLKKKTPGKSPKTPKRNEPSPKRPKLVDIFAENEEKAKLVNNARHLIQSVGATVSHLGRDDILLFLVSKIGFSTTTKLINSVQHIPENFPRRDTYIQAIMGTASWDDIQLAQQCAISNSLSVTSFQITEFMDILWQRSMENMTPYMCFLSPPVGWCIHCNRKLVERSVCKVTLYTMNGPLPGLKCSLRCSSCGITYELDRFHQDSCDSQFYESRLQQDLISASGRVFFTKDVFELLCELGFVSI